MQKNFHGRHVPAHVVKNDTAELVTALQERIAALGLKHFEWNDSRAVAVAMELRTERNFDPDGGVELVDRVLANHPPHSVGEAAAWRAALTPKPVDITDYRAPVTPRELLEPSPGTDRPWLTRDEQMIADEITLFDVAVTPTALRGLALEYAAASPKNVRLWLRGRLLDLQAGTKFRPLDHIGTERQRLIGDGKPALYGATHMLVRGRTV